MAMPLIKIVDSYNNTADMINAAIAAGFRPAEGYSGFVCKKCKRKYTALKFLKNKGTVFACNICGARWGSLIK